MDSKDKVINDLLSRIAKLEYEVERLENRNKEIYEGFMATTEELCKETQEKEHYQAIVESWE
jgi:chaperonin cofactor prefoldin